MLSPEAERVMRYLVEVEELAEAVLSDKRQVRDAAAASFVSWASARGSGASASSALGSSLPLTLSLRAPRNLTLCMRLPRPPS